MYEILEYIAHDASRKQADQVSSTLARSIILLIMYVRS